MNAITTIEGELVKPAPAPMAGLKPGIYENVSNEAYHAAQEFLNPGFGRSTPKRPLIINTRQSRKKPRNRKR